LTFVLIPRVRAFNQVASVERQVKGGHYGAVVILGVVVSEEYRLAAHPASRVPQVPPGRLSLSKQSQNNNIRQ
jgi:hypothetical protein